MTTVLPFAVLGLAIGAVYALLAEGMVAIYTGSSVLNFAQGAMAMVCGFLFADFTQDRGWATALALPASLVAGAILGIVIYQGVMRPLRNASNLARVIGTLGVLITLQ